jgi:uncharacterized protein
VEPDLRERLVALADKAVDAGEGPRAPAPDPVNTVMIRHWTEAMGDRNPRYAGPEGIAPPAMIQVWTMAGLDTGAAERFRAPLNDVLDALDEAGYTGVVATNCEHTYHRYLRPGEELTSAARMDGMTGPKQTALGEGYFVTWTVTWYASGKPDEPGKPDDPDEPVAEMLFRLLKFRPRQSPEPPARQGPEQQAQQRPQQSAEQSPERTPERSPEQQAQQGPEQSPEQRAGQSPERRPQEPYPLRPAVTRDTAFFWEGARRGELRIRKCASCGVLRHPPGPLCPACRSTERTYVVASGEGTVYSYVVHHHPPVPGLEAPFAVAVVELPEGVRIVGNVVDCPSSEVTVGMPVRVVFRVMDDELTLPMWVPREGR